MQIYEIIFLIVFVVLIIIGVVIVAFLLKNKQKPTQKYAIDGQFVENIIACFGNNENIKTIDVDGTKLKVEVNNLDVVDLDKLKELANSGVFVSGKTIKSLFKYDSMQLKLEIDKYRRIG